MANHIEEIKQHFSYLINDYGFQVTHEQYSPEIMGNAAVVYKSTSTGIIIVVDRGQVLINIGRISWPEADWFEFGDVVCFFDPSITEVEVYDFTVNTADQMVRLALFLRKYGSPLLEGDYFDNVRLSLDLRHAMLTQPTGG